MTTEEMYMAGSLAIKHLANSLVATAAMRSISELITNGLNYGYH
jgi:hypothetical protein